MFIRKVSAIAVLLAFLVNSLGPVYAQAILPYSTEMRCSGQSYNPPFLKGIKVFPNNDQRIDFILDPGDEKISEKNLKNTAERLSRYFFASLTLPASSLWVNLAPYDQKHIIPVAFGMTEMGRDILAEDYVLKQMTASAIHPETPNGREFWDRVYGLAQEKYGTIDIPLDVFNKVWIVPARAEVTESGGGTAAYVSEAYLRVLSDNDYQAQSGSELKSVIDVNPVMREVILPELEKEVNEGRCFAVLRQVYHSLILASWYKKQVHSGTLVKDYADQNRVNGLDIQDPRICLRVWSNYVKTFKNGAFDLIDEKQDPVTGIMTPKRFFSGGITLDISGRNPQIPALMLKHGDSAMNFSHTGDIQVVSVRVAAVRRNSQGGWEWWARDNDAADLDLQFRGVLSPGQTWRTVRAGYELDQSVEKIGGGISGLDKKRAVGFVSAIVSKASGNDAHLVLKRLSHLLMILNASDVGIFHAGES